MRDGDAFHLLIILIQYLDQFNVIFEPEIHHNPRREGGWEASFLKESMG